MENFHTRELFGKSCILRDDYKNNTKLLYHNLDNSCYNLLQKLGSMVRCLYQKIRREKTYEPTLQETIHMIFEILVKSDDVTKNCCHQQNK